jgi:diguanylate cyclase (GGDEF)-like protein
MSVRENMAAFLASQLDFIFFFYGFAFILLGAVCFAIARARQAPGAAIFLGMFGFIHGIREWLDLLALIATDSPEFMIARTAVMTISFLFLMEFARSKAIAFGLKAPGPWLYVPLTLLVLVSGAIGGVSTAEAATRYAIGFPATIAACLVFARHAKDLSGTPRRLAICAAASMALYGIAAGAIVQTAPFWPSNTFNSAWFVDVTGIPIQLVRGMLACTLAFALWGMWGQLLVREVSSDQYTAHIHRQFVRLLAAMTAIVMLGWTLTEFLGEIYNRNIQQTAEGDITLLRSRLDGETAIVDGMVRALAGSPAVWLLLTGKSPQAGREARSVLDLHVDLSGARFGSILDLSGAVVASSDIDGSTASNQSSQTWFRHAVAGNAGYYFAFDPVSGERSYSAISPVYSGDGAIVGVAVLQKSLDSFEADLRRFSRPYFLINPDGIIALTNRPAMMTRPLWPLSAERKSRLARELGPFDDRPVLNREVVDAMWTLLDGEQDYVRRSFVGHSQWSLVIGMPSERIFASRILGIIITFLVTIIVLIYFIGREHGIRHSIQVERRTELQKLAGDLRLQARTDRLTGLSNRLKFDESLVSEMMRSQRYKTPLAVIIFDVDHFKQVNDVHGHQVGDDMLVRLAQIVSRQIRGNDLLARWGGEEFVILTPGLDGPAAYRASEKLRAFVAASTLASIAPITCSFGIAEYVEGDTPDELISRADNALYRAKANGRNRVEIAFPPDRAANGVVSAA